MKLVNLILGLAAAIILSSLIILGIKAFYPEPVSLSYPVTPPYYAPKDCAPTDTACITEGQQSEAQYQAQQQAAQDQFNQEQDAYQNQMQVYDKNLFIIANIIGIIVFAIGFFLVIFASGLAAGGVPIGIMLAGLWSILYGYGRGWGSVDDQLKFFVGLVIALVILGGSMWLMQRHARKQMGG